MGGVLGKKSSKLVPEEGEPNDGEGVEDEGEEGVLLPSLGGGGTLKDEMKDAEGGGADDNDDDEDGEAKGDGRRSIWGFKKTPYVDPPMPDIGNKVDFDKLLNRKLNVKAAMRTMFKVIQKDTAISKDRASAIPVTDMIERVKVTEPIVDLIRTRSSKKEDRQFVKDNVIESQRYLSLRKSTLIMMNHNYNDFIVRKPDTVHAKEARTVDNLKQDDAAIIAEGGKDEVVAHSSPVKDKENNEKDTNEDKVKK